MNTEELRTILSKNIKFFRSLRSLSQADLAERAGISITFLSDIERGNKWPYIDTLTNLATALHVQVYELLKPKGEEAVAHDIASILTKYSEDATLYLEKLIPQSLEQLRKQYLGIES